MPSDSETAEERKGSLAKQNARLEQLERHMLDSAEQFHRLHQQVQKLADGMVKFKHADAIRLDSLAEGLGELRHRVEMYHPKTKPTCHFCHRQLPRPGAERCGHCGKTQ